MSIELDLLKRHLVGSEIIDVEFTEDNEPIVLIMNNGDRLEIYAMAESMALLRILLTNENNINIINI